MVLLSKVFIRNKIDCHRSILSVKITCPLIFACHKINHKLPVTDSATSAMLTHTSLKIWTLQIFSGTWIGLPHNLLKGPGPSHHTRYRRLLWNSNWHCDPSATGTLATIHSWNSRKKRVKKHTNKSRGDLKCESEALNSKLKEKSKWNSQVRIRLMLMVYFRIDHNSVIKILSQLSTLTDNCFHSQLSRNFWSKIS